MHKTEKDQPGAKELHGSWKANREGGKPHSGRGGQVNLLRLAEEELEVLEAESAETNS